MDRTKEYSFVLSTMPRLHARSRLLELGVLGRGPLFSNSENPLLELQLLLPGPESINQTKPNQMASHFATILDAEVMATNEVTYGCKQKKYTKQIRMLQNVSSYYLKN